MAGSELPAGKPHADQKVARLHSSFVAPEADVEAVAEAESEVAAEFGELGGAAVESGGGPAFGHEEDAVGGDGEAAAETLDRGEIGGRCDDEFEPCLRACREPIERGRMDAQGFLHSGVGEFGRDVELVHRVGESGRGDLRAVGFHLEHAVGQGGADVPDQREKVGLLKQRFAPGEDDARTAEGDDALRDFGGSHLDDDVVFPVFRVAGSAVFFVFPRRAFEVPSVVGIAPDAVEIAERRAHEYGGAAGGYAFALDGVEDFRAVAEFRELHRRKQKPRNTPKATKMKELAIMRLSSCG